MPPSPPPQPGPVEASILAAVAPTFSVRFTDSGLRVLEGGDGPPIVLIPGRGAAVTTWIPILRPLALRYRVLAVDLPGFGGSASTTFGGRDFEAGVDFFTAPIEDWLDREGLRGATVIGHSLGGLVAVETALRRRVAPGRLVLIGCMGLGPQMSYLSRAFFRAGPERLARGLGPAVFNRLVPAVDTPEGKSLAALDYEIYTASERRDAARAFDALYPTFGPVPHRFSRLHEIAAPTLVLWGDHDEVFPAPVAIAAAAAFPQGELRIEPTGHSPQREIPDKVISAILHFIRVTRAD